MNKKQKKSGLVFVYACLFWSGMILLAVVFWPMAKLEITYATAEYPPTPDPLVVEQIQVNNQVSLAIPKIGAYASIISHVDPFNQSEYELALEQGVAQARGSVLPGENGNSFLFAHSSTDWRRARRVNTQFYLLDKLEIGDQIYTYNQGQEFVYQVTSKKIVLPSQVEYLAQFSATPTLSLMTCYPIGTSLQRLIIEAEIISDN